MKKVKKIEVQSKDVPVYRDAGFLFHDVAEMKSAFREEEEYHRSPDFYIYSRYRNPTVVAAENEIMKKEDCGWALLTQSGLAAIDLALAPFHRGDTTGTWLFFSEIYGGTNSFIDRVLVDRRGIDVKRFYPANDRYDLEELEKIMAREKPALVYFETVSNPTVMVADGEAIIQMAQKHGAKVVLDNTFATPYLWRPLQAGADIVLHSVTKYLSGHNNITAGVVCGNDPALLKDALEYRKYVGHMLSPDDAFRLSSQLETFEMRFERHCDNAARLARTLAAHDKVEKVLYPGLEPHPTHEEAQKIFRGKGFGAMITFDLKGDNYERKGEAAARFISALSGKIPLIPTLGATRTLMMHVESVWSEKYPNPGLIRFSVGIEDYPELEATILEGLSRV